MEVGDFYAYICGAKAELSHYLSIGNFFAD